MRIHVQQVLDYVICSKLYQFRHIDKIEPETRKNRVIHKNSILELYNQALHKNIAYLFHSIQDGFYPSLSKMKQKWGYLWVKPRAKQEDSRFRESSWRDTHNLKRKEGWNKLNDLWHYYEEQPGTPIMVDYEYEVSIGKHTLVGTIDLVRVVKNEMGREKIEMIEFVTDEKKAPFLHIRRDWSVTAASYAFRKIMNVNEEKIVYHGIISGKLTETERTESDYKQLEQLLDIIEKSIEHNLFYPTFNERCLTCPYDKQCEKG